MRWPAISCRPVCSSVSSTSSGCGYSEATIAISSPTERSRMSAPVCNIAPIQPASIAAVGEPPSTDTVPPSGSRQAEDHVDRRGLACTVGPQQRNRLPRLDRDVDAAYGFDRPVALAQACGLDRASSHASPYPAAGKPSAPESSPRLDEISAQRRCRAAFKRSVLPSATLRMRTVSGVTSTHSSSRTNSSAWSSVRRGGAASAPTPPRWRSGCW